LSNFWGAGRLSGRAGHFKASRASFSRPDDCPEPEPLRQEIQEGKGFVLKLDGAIAGHMCVDFDGEPAYDVIEG
jgi:hypothetical protein